jgi:hypothetical protein
MDHARLSCSVLWTYLHRRSLHVAIREEEQGIRPPLPLAPLSSSSRRALLLHGVELSRICCARWLLLLPSVVEVLLLPAEAKACRCVEGGFGLRRRWGRCRSSLRGRRNRGAEVRAGVVDPHPGAEGEREERERREADGRKREGN